ncbi:hypothetical protein QYE76_007454 [Lolium multiflorum]|uniref:Uncharacterized protein n=1 Tax=Lolium multiflorum TaxID=4521 RepID=A0AAD8W4C5_LOLMU|nr:hypothetical protein QYE76_007454 [Lolium multiflorum]
MVRPSTGGAWFFISAFGLLPGDSKTYGLQPHNISPNGVLAIGNHVTLRRPSPNPLSSLFQYFFLVKKEKIRRTSELATCGSITFILRRVASTPTDRHESRVPPKASSATKPDPKDVIDLDDLPEDPAHHGDSAKGTSSPVLSARSAKLRFRGPTEKNRSKRQSSCYQRDWSTSNQLRPSKAYPAQRHAEVSAMLNKVWGNRTRRKAAKHSSFDELSAKVKVLEAENESLKAFIQESSSKETERKTCPRTGGAE